jgi:site-specific DNA-methyltransferase (adenine-specific)
MSENALGKASDSSTDMDKNVVHTGDSFETLPELPDNAVHAVVTDPPYGLAFMGRDWDDFEPKEYQEWCEKWAKAVKRVLKPGGHLLAFSGNRTHHRLFAGVEDAGFEIRDTITWHYGSGFPKASDISKTIDKRADVERTEGKRVWKGGERQGGDWSNSDRRGEGTTEKVIYDEPATPEAEEWDGFKTGLKPATEYVVVARKPFDGATVDCVLEHGTGALNIDGTRIDSVSEADAWDGDNGFSECDGNALEGSESGELNTQNSGLSTEGRYPSNVVFDETAAAALDREVGELAGESRDEVTSSDGRMFETGSDNCYQQEPGGPSRYFYTSKASKAERTEDGSIDNSHPTVKPIDLMEWLIKLVTKENQIVLDPFCGSGTTLKACKALNRQFIGIEKQAKWADVARVRCGLTPDDPSVVRDDEDQTGLESYE